MADESPIDKLATAADAVKGIAEAIPVYPDAVQPAAQEFGKTIQPVGREIGEAVVVVAKTINLAMAPLRGFIWGYEKIGTFLQSTLTEKLEGTPAEDIQTPKPHVAVPAIEALRYTGDEEALRDLYANLLAASVDIKTVESAHPAFVEIIKQMTSDEAKIMKYFSDDYLSDRTSVRLGLSVRYPIVSFYIEIAEPKGTRPFLKNFSVIGEKSNCQSPNLLPEYIDNLSRLGLIHCRDSSPFTDKKRYREIEDSDYYKNAMAYFDKVDGITMIAQRGIMELTSLGIQFVRGCVIDHKDLKKAISGSN